MVERSFPWSVLNETENKGELVCVGVCVCVSVKMMTEIRELSDLWKARRLFCLKMA